MSEPKRYSVSIETATIFKVVLIFVLIVGLYFARNLVMIVLTSLVLASFIENIVRRLGQYHVPRFLAVIGVYVLSLLVIFVVFYLFVPLLVRELSSLVQALGSYFPDDTVLHALQPGASAGNGFMSNFTDPNSSVEFRAGIQNFISNSGAGVLQTVSVFFGGVFNAVLIAVITFYLSIEEHGIEHFLRVISPIRKQEYVIGLWARTQRKIGLWMAGQLFLGLILGIVIYCGLVLLGAPYALVIALIAALLEIIPFGIYLAGCIGVVFAYTFVGPILALKVLILYVVTQQFEGYVLAPYIVNRVIGVSPLVVILSVLIGGELAGVWGVLIAVPVAVGLLEYIGDREKTEEIITEIHHV
jgi:predicted PurR-regulated permease PerM